MVTATSRSAGIRAKCGFPFVDSDGHQGALASGFEDYLRREAGSNLASVQTALAKHDPGMMGAPR